MKGINHHLDIGIRRFKVVAKTHILSTIFQIRLSSFLSLNLLCSTEYLNRKDGPFLFYSCCIYVRDIIQCNRVTRSNEITMKKHIQLGQSENCMKRAYYIIPDILQPNLILKTCLKWFIIENVSILKVDVFTF